VADTAVDATACSSDGGTRRLLGTGHAMPELYQTVTLDGYDTAADWERVGVVTSAAVEQDSVVETLDEQAQVEYGNYVDLGSSFVTQPCVYSYPEAMMELGCVVATVHDCFMYWSDAYDGVEIVEKTHAKKNVLESAVSVNDDVVHRVRWTVDARKLKSKDKEAVSPAFTIGEDGIEFKMILRPRETSEAKGGGSFKKARGRGVVLLRCLERLTPDTSDWTTFQISIGNPADAANQRQPRGPVEHNFGLKPIGGLPQGQDQWNFSQVVDKNTETFVVILEVLGRPPDECSSPRDP